jgi:hypothetical protein
MRASQYCIAAVVAKREGEGISGGDKIPVAI